MGCFIFRKRFPVFLLTFDFAYDRVIKSDFIDQFFLNSVETFSSVFNCRRASRTHFSYISRSLKLNFNKTIIKITAKVHCLALVTMCHVSRIKNNHKWFFWLRGERIRSQISAILKKNDFKIHLCGLLSFLKTDLGSVERGRAHNLEA